MGTQKISKNVNSLITPKGVHSYKTTFTPKWSYYVYIIHPKQIQRSKKKKKKKKRERKEEAEQVDAKVREESPTKVARNIKITL